MTEEVKREFDPFSRDLLRQLVAGSDYEAATKAQLQNWIASAMTGAPHPAGKKRRLTMKSWVVKTIAEAGPKGVALKDLKAGFQDEFGNEKARSLNQYLGKGMGLAEKTDDRTYKLTKKGQAVYDSIQER